jgi:hypothetical protein
MNTVLEPPASTSHKSTTVTTTLYDLVEAVQKEVGAANDELIVATVMHLLRAGHATYLRSTRTRSCN